MRPKRFLTLRYIWCKPCTYLAPTLTPSLNGPKQDSTRPTSPRSSIGCVQNDFRACGTFCTNHAPILRQYYHYLQTDRNELSVQPRYLVVRSGASKMIPEPMVRLAQTVHLSCTDSNSLQMDRNKIRHDACNLGVPSEACKTISEPMVQLVQTVHLSCTDASTTSKRTKTRFHMTHVT